ncbi:adenylosuccinate synthase [bacterium]|nr:adenylosuccinate synthase [bacterium]
MSVKVVVGAQWGDEGKGKITDILAEGADVVVRYQGGSNAGHTVVAGGEEFKLHLIPSGILRDKVISVMGDGTVIDPSSLVQEIEGLQARGISCNNLRISGCAHVIMPYHRLLDGLEEESRGVGGIGTTRRGIGPAYTDKTARMPRPIRMWDMLSAEVLRERITAQLAQKNVLLQSLYNQASLTVDEVFEEVWGPAQRIHQYITDTRMILFEQFEAGANILFEGAQGTFLDLDYGTFPFVTSSHPVSGGACLGTGIGPTQIQDVYMVAKAYTTRVGAGAFPTEDKGKDGNEIRERGHEYGTTTGRPRRCGWLDLVVLKTSARINSATGIALTLLDVLDAFEKLPVCVAYEVDGKRYDMVPSDVDLLERVTPVYEERPGWGQNICECETYDALPAAAREYVEYIEKFTGVPVKLIGVGKGREQTILR